MSSTLYALGRAAFRARRRITTAWLLVLVLSGAAAAGLGTGMTNDFTIPGTRAQAALDELAGRFPEVSGGQAQLVAVAPDRATVYGGPQRAGLTAAVQALRRVDGVVVVTDPFAKRVSGTLSADRRAALVTIQFDEPWEDVTEADRAALVAAAGPARDAGLRTEFGGPVFGPAPPAPSLIEAAGVGIALVILLLTLGSLRAAGMPLLTALLGVGVTMALIFTATAFTSVSASVPLLGLMIGLAVGIDYALFVLSRHRDQLGEGLDPEESAARAIATAGSAVVFAGLTVVIALVGLAVARIPFLTTMGLAAAGAVVLAVLVALTLLPALMGFAGERLAPGRRRPVPARRVASRHIRAVTRWPLVTMVLAVAGLGVLAVPATDLRLALPGNEAAPVGTTGRASYDLIAEHFGPGYNSPLLVTADIIRTTDPLGVVDGIADRLRDLPGVAAVTVATPNRTADTGIVVVMPSSDAATDSTKELVGQIRGLDGYFQDRYGVAVQVTGQTALLIDVSDRLSGALLPFGAFVVGLSTLLLGAVFRSLVVPVTAAAGYLLSVAATFGVVAAVFEWGWFNGPLGVERTGPVISFMPIILMGILFGLAMDYQVFLVSRMREAYVHGSDPLAAIHTGYTASARVVTAAALIMVAVFAAFVPHGDPTIKPVALALAVGVTLDAFVVRMILVPAMLALVGRAAWWLPGWLERRLPRLDVEGERLHEQLELAQWPRPGSGNVVDAEDLALTGPDGALFEAVELAVPPGVVVALSGDSATARTALLLVLAGRMPADSGRLKVTGLPLPADAGRVLRRTGLAELPGVDPLDPSLTVGQHIAEHLAARSLRPWVPRSAITQVLDVLNDALLGATGTRGGVDGREPVAALTPLQRKGLGIALALVGSPALVLVGDAVELRTAAEREAFWRMLDRVTAHRAARSGEPVTVIASCHDTDDADAAVAAVPPDRLRLHELGTVHPLLERVS
jgi:RND superfamily putative drug exporter